MKRLCRAVRAHTGLACLALLAVLMLSVVLGISLGPVTIPFPEVWRVMLHRLLTPLGLGDWISLEGIRDSTQNIVWHLRAPRVLLGMLVGAALTLSGVGMQAFTRNPLAEPYVLGISSGASLGAVLAMLVGVWLPMGRLSVPTGAFVGALVSILLVYGLSRSGGAVTPVRLILVGVAVSAMFQAFTNYLVYTAPDDAAVREATFWMLGGLGSAKWEDLPLLALILPPLFLVLMALARPLNAMLMGDSWLQTILRVVTPNALSSLIEVFSYYFINSMVTISALIFIAGARTMVLTTMIKQLQYVNRFNEVFVMSLLILATNLVAKALFSWLAGYRSKHSPKITKKEGIK